MNNNLTDILIENPRLSGDTSNGDSIEIQHRGSTNGVLNVDIRNALLKDPASTNIKLIEAGNPDNGVYNVSVRDSVLSNINTNGNEDAQIRYNGTERIATKAIWLSLDNVEISGLGRGIGLTVPALGGRTRNANDILSFRIKVQNSSLSDLTGEAIYWWQASTDQLGSLADPPVIDLGGGPLGSQGNNRFVHNGDPNYVPPGANPAGIDPHSFDGDISVGNARPAPANPAIGVYASQNFWGGAAPVVSSVPGQDVFIPPPPDNNVTFSAPTFLTVDPQ
jgi:hypothetical protein